MTLNLYPPFPPPKEKLRVTSPGWRGGIEKEPETKRGGERREERGGNGDGGGGGIRTTG